MRAVEDEWLDVPLLEGKRTEICFLVMHNIDNNPIPAVLTFVQLQVAVEL